MTSILDPVRHARLLQDADAVCGRAGIGTRHLHESMTNLCNKTEVTWVQTHRTNGSPGMLLFGPKALDRCMYMAGAFVRNFIDARVRTVEEIIDDPSECSVLLCPNFYTSATAKGMPLWRQQKLFDTLVSRYKTGQKTVLWAESQNGLKEYGAAMEGLLREYQQSNYA